MNLVKKIAAGTILSLSALGASAGTLDVSVDGVSSWDGEGSGFNTIITIALDAPATITGIGWDVVVEAFGASWTNEATVSFGPIGGPAEVFLAPCVNSSPGIEACSSGGIIDFASIPIPDLVLTDGMLQLEFFESFDDVTGAIDAEWSGTLTIQCEGECQGGVAVSEPGILVLFGLGLLGVVAARRRMV